MPFFSWKLFVSGCYWVAWLLPYVVLANIVHRALKIRKHFGADPIVSVRLLDIERRSNRVRIDEQQVRIKELENNSKLCTECVEKSGEIQVLTEKLRKTSAATLSLANTQRALKESNAEIATLKSNLQRCRSECNTLKSQLNPKRSL